MTEHEQNQKNTKEKILLELVYWRSRTMKQTNEQKLSKADISQES